MRGMAGKVSGRVYRERLPLLRIRFSFKHVPSSHHDHLDPSTKQTGMWLASRLSLETPADSLGKECYLGDDWATCIFEDL